MKREAQPSIISMTKTCIIVGLAGLLLSGEGDALHAQQQPAGAVPGALGRLGEAPALGDRIQIIDQFVHHRYYDPAGLMYSHVNWREERPFVKGDFTPADSTMPGPEPEQWMSYENSPFVSGVFLAAQCYRYQATRDPEALDYAKRAYGSINLNYQLSERRDPAAAGLSQRAGIIEAAAQPEGATAGFFCKPYYGRATDHTSTEQHFAPLVGLYRYWPMATPDVRARIRQIFSEVSARWRGGYKINYFSETWDLEQSYPRAQRHMFLWSIIHRMAFEITGEKASYDEFARLDALYGAIPTPRETAWGLGRPSYISTEDRSFHVQIVIGAEILMELEPARRGRLLRGMEEWWKYSFVGQRDDLLSYYFIRVDTLTGDWEKLPHAIKPREFWRSPFMLHNATLPICWQGTRERQGITSAIVARHVPAQFDPATERLGRIFHDLDKEHLKWFADPEGVMPAELQWMLNVLQGDSLAFYSLGYWYARTHGLPLP